MMLSPQMNELRSRFDSAGVPYVPDDSEAENDEGWFQHVERTDTDMGFALYAWSRDADGMKHFQSDLGRFADYIEVDIGESRQALTVGEAFDALSGRRP